MNRFLLFSAALVAVALVGCGDENDCPFGTYPFNGTCYPYDSDATTGPGGGDAAGDDTGTADTGDDTGSGGDDAGSGGDDTGSTDASGGDDTGTTDTGGRPEPRHRSHGLSVGRHRRSSTAGGVTPLPHTGR